MNAKQEENINKEYLKLKARKRIFTIIIIGIIALTGDLIISLHGNTIELAQDEKGLYMVRPSSGENAEHVTLRAQVNEQDFDKSFDLRIDSVGESDSNRRKDNADLRSSKNDADGGMSKNELVAFEVRSAVNSVNNDTSRNRVYLPDVLSTGDNVQWTVERKSNTALILLTVVLLAVFIYRNRFAPLRKRTAEEQDSIARQLPEFVNRLVLLLNAGLVLNTAFEKAVSTDSYASDSSQNNDFFMSKMQEIQGRIHETNVSLNREFRDFAKSRRAAGGDASRQLMRISNIISDNISKGVELTDKLQRESEVLWLARKRNCEERGRLAETKLTLPLTLFLLVLIVITVSPALLEL